MQRILWATEGVRQFLCGGHEKLGGGNGVDFFKNKLDRVSTTVCKMDNREDPEIPPGGVQIGQIRTQPDTWGLTWGSILFQKNGDT